MTLPLINQFLFPCEIWETRPAERADFEERLLNGWHIARCTQSVKVNLLDKIDTPDKAAQYIHDGRYNVQIENYIEKSLSNIKSHYTLARQSMPSVTPDILSKYQRLYSSGIDMFKVDSAITSGDYLADNQILFHGGGLLNNTKAFDSFVTSRPLSTSLCPVKAFINGAWRGKYYNEGEVNLIILTAKKISKKAFVFRMNGTDKGHEKEILISSGATLTIISKYTIANDFIVYGMGTLAGQALKKSVSFNVTHAIVT
ncbi:hypothetical protein [Pantoea agglomerans]|uniref:hypothetical protein n=1 Tax=Enterobacter agglomerans TaxID=549 RepID=UPI003DA12500